LSKAGLPILDTINIIKSRRELSEFDWQSLPDSFALKPNRGFGGGGILVVYGRKKKSRSLPSGTKLRSRRPSINLFSGFKKTKNTQVEIDQEKEKNLTWIRADRSLITKEKLESHIFDILEGNFSLFYMPDIAFFEERVKVVKELKPYSWKGIPDVRVIVYEGIPVMAMLRLPTKESRGKANLHDGAIGVGVDLATGRTLSAISRGTFIDYYPGTRYLLRGIKVPSFKESLRIAVNAQKRIKARFLGVDIAVDREKGPMILELNLRPGLQIQIANMAGLEGRLRRVKGLSLKSEKRAVRLAQQLFGAEEYEEEEIYGKKVLGVIEEAEIPYKDIKKGKEIEKRYKKLAKIDTGASRTSISYDILKKLKIEEFVEKRIVRSSLGEEIRPTVPLTFYLKKEKIETEVFVSDRAQMKYEMIIGRRDLKNFVINPAKTRYLSR
jgi:alpha-L-glutamate ligase-like protein